jgi:outer membrane protein
MNKLLVLLSLLLSVSVFAQTKVGIINIQKVIRTIKEGKAVNTTLTKSFKSKEKQLKAEEAKIKKQQEAYQKQTMLLSGEAKAKKEQEIRKAIAELQKKTMAYQKEIQKQEAQLKKPILDKLKPIIDSVSSKKGVDLTFEISSSPIVYAKTQVDITDEVIKEYDKKHK